jgi:hypothetical protein
MALRCRRRVTTGCQMAEDIRDEVVRSFYRMRRMLGMLGLFLPVVLILGGFASLGIIAPSISDYYHTLMRDVLVGTLTAIAVFLICYPGHRRASGEGLSDDVVATLGGIGALGVAFFPNVYPGAAGPFETVSQDMLGGWTKAGHYISAIIFLSSLAWLSLFRFSRTADRGRRRIYRACGWVIVTMTVLTIVTSVIKVAGPAGPQAMVNGWALVLWCEAVAVWAFAVSWLVKGRADQALVGRMKARRR